MKKNKEGVEWNIESLLNSGINGCVETSESIITIGVEFTLFINVVFVIFFAYVVDTEENVDDRHCCFGFFLS